MAKKVLVTGGAGFIGSHVGDELPAAGQFGAFSDIQEERPARLWELEQASS